MPLQFTLTNNKTHTDTVIDEPVGMDKVSLHLKRDATYHGFLDAVDDSLGSFQFYGASYDLLTAAYRADGVEADISLLIQYQCADDGLYSTLYHGRFSFDQYKEVRGIDGCYVECGIQNGLGLQTFRSRMNQKVSLDSTACFDTGYPPLPAYPGLGTLAAMQPMTIRMVNYATIDTNPIGSRLYGLTSEDYNVRDGLYEDMRYYAFAAPASTAFGTDGGASNPQGNEFDLGNDYQTNIITPYANIRSQELGDFPGPVGDIYFASDITALDSANPIFTFTPDIPYEDYNIDIDIELTMGVINGRDGNQRSDLQGLMIDVLLAKGLDWNDARTNLHRQYDFTANDGSAVHGSDRYPFSHPCKIDQKGITVRTLNSDLLAGVVDAEVIQYSFHTKDLTPGGKGIIMQPGEQLYLLVMVRNPPIPFYTNQIAQIVFFSDTYTYRNSYYASGHSSPFTIWKTLSTSQDYYKMEYSGAGVYRTTNGQALSYIRISYDSKYRVTPAPVYMVGESLSRTAEIITNGEYQVCSDYFGRPGGHGIASLPYTPSIAGPAGKSAITNGLLIRGYSPLQAYYMGVSQNSFAAINFSTYTLSHFEIPQVSSGVILSMDNSTGSIVTIPTNASVIYNIGTEFIIQQSTDGIVSIQGAPGVKLIAPAGKYVTEGLGSQILVTCIADDTWLIASRATMFCSFQDVMDCMKSIHAVGFGMENDPTRPDKRRIRVEPISHFYDNSTIMMTCENVDSVTTTSDASACIAEFEVGYGKWEAEQAQGLDEFLTKRTYRTGLSVLRSKRSEISKFVASGYAIESTRRRLGTTTTDWRYDKDLFILCLDDTDSPYEVDCNLGLYTNKGSQLLTYGSENGGLGDYSRIIDAKSIYNARISPARNAMRWLKYIFQCFSDPVSKSLIFTEGDGNYYASGKLQSNAIENNVVSENQNLKLSDIADNTFPIWLNEKVTFKYPLGYNEWLNIYNAQTGKIKYSVNNGVSEYGFLQEMKYNLYEGIAEFTLIKAV